MADVGAIKGAGARLEPSADDAKVAQAMGNLEAGATA